MHQNRNDVEKRKPGQDVALNFPAPLVFKKKHLSVVKETKIDLGKQVIL